VAIADDTHLTLHSTGGSNGIASVESPVSYTIQRSSAKFSPATTRGIFESGNGRAASIISDVSQPQLYLYQSVLNSAAQLTLTSPLSTSNGNGVAIQSGVNGEDFVRLSIHSDAKIGLGPGTVTRDVYIRRSGTNQLQVCNVNASNSPIPGALDVYGGFSTSYASVTTSSRARASNVATITTSSAHTLFVGARINISGLSGTGYNGVQTVVSIPSSTTFTYASTGSDESTATDTNGTVLISGLVSIAPTNAAPNILLSIGASAASATVQQTIQINNNGYDVPSAVNASSNGDKLVMYNTSAGKIAIGMDSNYSLWFTYGSNTNTNGSALWYTNNSGTVNTMELTSTSILKLINTTAAGSSPQLRIFGITTGYAGFQAPATAGNNVWTLPTADGLNGGYIKTDGSGNLAFETNYVPLNFSIDGGGLAITTGAKGWVVIEYAATIVGWTLIADQSGSATVDIKRATYSGYTGSGTGTSLVGGSGNGPTMSSAVKGQATSLTNWTSVTLAAGDILEFNVSSVSTVQKLTVELKLQRL
jgi:hypothetical protein